MQNLSNFIITEGKPVSNGITEGKASVIESSADFPKVQNSSQKIILIVKNFEPNFDVLLDKCLGVVSEMGNMLCHLAIVSRIRKIPAIINAKYVTSMIRDHENITIDAYNGIIYKGLHLNKLKNENQFDFIQDFYTKIEDDDS